jgi:hypothetical protein
MPNAYGVLLDMYMAQRSQVSKTDMGHVTLGSVER